MLKLTTYKCAVVKDFLLSMFKGIWTTKLKEILSENRRAYFLYLRERLFKTISNLFYRFRFLGSVFSYMILFHMWECIFLTHKWLTTESYIHLYCYKTNHLKRCFNNSRLLTTFVPAILSKFTWRLNKYTTFLITHYTSVT